MLPLLKQVYRLAVMLLFAIVAGELSAQQVTPISFPLVQENIFIKPYATYTLSKKPVPDFTTLSSYTFASLQAFGSGNSLKLSDTVESGWIYFAIQNKLTTDTLLVLKTHPLADRVILYEQQGNTLQEIGRTGQAMPVSQLAITNDYKRIPISLKAGLTQFFFLRQQRHSPTSWLNIPQLQSQTQSLIEEKVEFDFRWRRNNLAFLLVGFQFAISIFGFIKYGNRQKDKSYLWYGLANLFTCIFLLVDNNIIVLDTPLWNNLNQWDYFMLFNILALLAALRFQVTILQLKQYSPKLTRLINIYSLLLGVSIMASLIANQLRIFPGLLLATRGLSNAFALITILIFISLRNRRTGFNKYIYYGLLCWIIGFCFYIPYIWFGLRKHLPYFITGNFMMGLPTVVEVGLFLKALVYRDNETEREKIYFQQQAIEQLEQNKALQQTFTADLEKQVQDRTTEVLEQRKIIEQEREDKLTADFKRRFSESELKALRSQINPHFIFNVLNTIESFALENNAEAASDMIQKFSRLTRLVLENSLHHVVPAADDLEALQLYIELEQVRYHGKFEAHVVIEKEVLEGNYAIPPMIIQPYVENAILHGLRNLSGKGKLCVHASVNGTFLIVTIEDNGIGRVRATALKQNEIIKRTSVGMSLTQDRISLFNNLLPDNKAVVSIHDLKQGTRVELKFPLAL